MRSAQPEMALTAMGTVLPAPEVGPYWEQVARRGSADNTSASWGGRRIQYAEPRPMKYFSHDMRPLSPVASYFVGSMHDSLAMLTNGA